MFSHDFRSVVVIRATSVTQNITYFATDANRKIVTMLSMSPMILYDSVIIVRSMNLFDIRSKLGMYI